MKKYELNITFIHCIQCGLSFLNVNSTLAICSYVCQNKIIVDYENYVYTDNLKNSQQIIQNRMYLKNYK